MFGNRVVFYDLLLQSHKVSCWHKKQKKYSLTSYPAPSISEAPSARPRAALSLRDSKKGILILLTELVEGNNGKDKKLQLWFFFSFSGKAFLRYDRWDDKWHIWKSAAVEDAMISWATNRLTWPFFFPSPPDMQLFGPLMQSLFVMQGMI